MSKNCHLMEMSATFVSPKCSPVTNQNVYNKDDSNDKNNYAF